MSADVIEQISRVAGAPDGFARLRALIYALATEGRLVPGADHAEQTTLGRVATFEMGQAPPGSECNKDGVGTVFVKTGEFGKRYPEVREWTTNPLKFAKRGDVLICVVGATVGKLNLAIDCAIGRSVAAVRPSGRLTTEYLYIALVPFTLRLREQSRGSAQGVIGKSELSAVSIRVPDVDEQHRIVAKVDELMALCDRLEARQQDAEAAHARLVQALLESLTQARDADEFQLCWQRVAGQFEDLINCDAAVEALKTAVVLLAVRGWLESQAPEDEDGSMLLKRLTAAKQVAAGSVRKQKAIAAADLAAPPFDAPAGWAWTHLDQVLAISGGVTLGRKLSGRAVSTAPYLRVANVQRGRLDLTEVKEIEVPSDEIEKYRLEAGDLLITEGGDWDKVGRTAVWADELPLCLHQNHVFRARRCSDELDLRWVELYLNSTVARDYFAGASKQTTNLASINMTQLRSCAFPVPPLAEQRRIVAKVTELLALCDQLKARLTAARAKHAQLAEALVAQAVAA